MQQKVNFEQADKKNDIWSLVADFNAKLQKTYNFAQIIQQHIIRNYLKQTNDASKMKNKRLCKETILQLKMNITL